MQGTITDEAGKPLDGAIVRLRDLERGREIAIKADKNGRFYRRGLQAVEYEMVVEKPGYQPVNDKAKLVAGTDRRFDFKLAKAAPEGAGRLRERRRRIQQGRRGGGGAGVRGGGAEGAEPARGRDQSRARLLQAQSGRRRGRAARTGRGARARSGERAVSAGRRVRRDAVLRQGRRGIRARARASSPISATRSPTKRPSRSAPCISRRATTTRPRPASPKR